MPTRQGGVQGQRVGRRHSGDLGVTRLKGVSGGGPRREATIEHPHRKPHPAQHPPGAAGGEGPRLVIDDDLLAGAHAGLSERVPQDGRDRQGVATVAPISGCLLYTSRCV